NRRRGPRPLCPDQALRPSSRPAGAQPRQRTTHAPATRNPHRKDTPMTTTTVIISLGDDSVFLTCDLANAAAPLRVDDQEIGYQTHDAQHDLQRAVLLAARRTWPEEQWPQPEDLDKEGTNEAWDALSYTTVDFDAVKEHGRRKGREDYLERAKDVALGHEDPEWAWPLSGADEAYLSAVGPGKICRDLDLPRAAWEAISETWFLAFCEGYEAA